MKTTIKRKDCEPCDIYNTCLFGIAFELWGSLKKIEFEKGYGCPWDGPPFNDKKVRAAIKKWKEPKKEVS